MKRQQPVGTYMLFGLIGFVCLLAAASPNSPGPQRETLSTYAAASTNEALIKLAIAFLDEDEAAVKEIGRYKGKAWMVSSEERPLLAYSFTSVLKRDHSITLPDETAWNILRQANTRR